MKALGHIEVVQLFVPVEAILFNMSANLVIDAFVLEPHDESGNRILLRQSSGFEEDAQECQSDTAARTGSQCAGCGVQAPMAFRLGAQLFEIISDALRQVGNSASRGSILEDRVDPKRTEHFDEVRFP